MAGQARRVYGDADQPRARNHGDQDRLVGEVGGVEDAECRARVADVREVEQPRNHRHARVQVERAPDELLRELVEADARAAAATPRAPRRGRGTATTSSMDRLGAARPGTARTSPAHSGSRETAATYRQQRSHFTPPARSIVTLGRAIARPLGPQLDAGHDEQHRQIGGVTLQQLEEGLRRRDDAPWPAASCRSACPCAAARSRPAPRRARRSTDSNARRAPSRPAAARSA